MTCTTQVLQAAAIALLAYILTYIYQSYRSALDFQAFARANNCQPPAFPPSYLPCGLDHVYKLLTYKGDSFLDDFIFARFKTAGRWTVVTPALGGTFTVMTADPRNIQTVLSTKFVDYGVGRRRYYQFGPLLGYGIFTADGPVWEHSRAILRPQFSRDQVDDLQAAEKHIQRLFQALPTTSDDGWTEQTDLEPLFLRFMLDFGTEWLFGKSVDSQLAYLDNQSTKASNDDSETLPSSDLGRLERSFDAAFRTAQDTLAWRIRMHGLYWLINSKKFRNACVVLHSWADHFVAEALKAKKAQDNPSLASPPAPAAAAAEAPVAADSKPRYSVLASMLTQTTDPLHLRSQSMSLLLAGRDSTARLLSFLFLELARHPSTWSQLRASVLATFGPDPSSSPPHDPSSPPPHNPSASYPPLTPQNLHLLPLLSHLINETLRLYPLIPLNARTTHPATATAHLIPKHTLGPALNGKNPSATPPGVPSAALRPSHRCGRHSCASPPQMSGRRWVT